MPPKNRQIRVRLAPSPTGPLHVGTARTALFNWLFARQNGGAFILRIEDTDRGRSEKKYELDIMEGLTWLGLEWDEGPAYIATSRQQPATSHKSKFGPYRQSERTEIYKKYLNRLLEEGRAYYCYCTKEELEAERQAMASQGLPPKYGGHCRIYAEQRGQHADLRGKKPQVIRFKTPEAIVEFKDIIRGKVSFDAALFGDIVVAKDLENPLYNFAAVVDDEEMKIGHVIRGEDHLSNTPKQILLQKALGFEEPQYAHLPLILSADRSKLSKRFAETALLDYKKQGYLPQAIVNFIALLGWHSKENKEVFSREELIKEFELKRVQKAGAVFNPEKLDWLQKEHLKTLSVDEIADLILPSLKVKKISTTKEFLKKVIRIERSRLKTFGEFLELAGFFFKLPEYGAELLVWQKGSSAKIRKILDDLMAIIKNTKGFNREELNSAILPMINEEGRGQVLWPLRVALSGQAASPDPLDIMEVLGREESERRLKAAVEKIANIQ